MVTCYENNVNLCYLPSHTSHGLQPLDNGCYNVLKRAYRKELRKYNNLTDATPVDKVNFIKMLYTAREAAFTPKTINSSWKVTGQYPVSRRQALLHPELQQEKEKRAATPPPAVEYDPNSTPKASRHVRDLGIAKSPTTRRQFGLVAKGFAAMEMENVLLKARIASLEEEVERKTRSRKRKALHNPTKRFETIGTAF
jgi:DDE superfamily endonuclease